MRVEPVVKALQTAVRTQVALTGTDAAVDDAVAQLLEGIGPALHVAVLQLAEQAAIEVGAQLPDHVVEVVLSEGEPTLRVTEATTPPPQAPAAEAAEEFDARITLRLPPSLKEAVEQAAVTQGASVNTWVVDAIDRSTKKAKRWGNTVTEEFDL